MGSNLDFKMHGSLLESVNFLGLQEDAELPANPPSYGIKFKADLQSISCAARFWNVSSVRRLKYRWCF